jgi:hypothetical protein
MPDAQYPYGLTEEIIRRYLPRIKWRRQTKLEQRANFDEKYPEDPITAFLQSGSAYFDNQIVIARRLELLHFKPWKWKDEGNGEGWQIFKQRVPGRRYLIGADVASGIQITSENTDYCAAVVVDLETGEEFAAYRSHVVPSDFAFELSDLGHYFNEAVIAVERNNQGGTTILTLAGECGYGNLYRHRDYLKRPGAANTNQQKVVELEGFPTTPKTRPIACNFLGRFVLDHPELIFDRQFLSEALTFVRDERGIPAAAVGAHDDTVSARWICHYCRRVLLGYFDPLGTKKERYIPSDQLVDSVAA